MHKLATKINNSLILNKLMILFISISFCLLMNSCGGNDGGINCSSNGEFPTGGPMAMCTCEDGSMALPGNCPEDFECGDNADNDLDGKIDLADNGCSMNPMGDNEGADQALYGFMNALLGLP